MCDAHVASGRSQISTIVACGGLAKNRLFLQEHADVTKCAIVLPREREPVVLGAAILGAVAARKYGSVREAMRRMNAPGVVVAPSGDPRVLKYHDAKYDVFCRLYADQKAYGAVMDGALQGDCEGESRIS